jgi:hypothetical protein
MRMRYAPLLCLLLIAPLAVAQTFDPRPRDGSLAASGAAFDNPRLQDGFFEATDYIGAFAPGGERWDLPWANYDPQNTDYGSPAGATVITGNINSDLTLTANQTYRLVGFVNVNAPATLTIEPGTLIFGDFESKGTLIINRGAKIDAQGTPEQPIVFTSAFPAGQRQGGDWGGVIIAGNASINLPGGEAVIEGGTGTVYGGGANPNDDDNSGIMRYVRLEFPGIEFSQDNEINGLTMGGVGRGTTIEYVQVSYCDDDSFEWFGGTVDGRYLISFAALDDDFDGDVGWRGRVQYGLIVRDPELADISGSNAFEQDGAPSEPAPPQTPRSRPTFSNVTVLGPLMFSNDIDPNYRRGAHIRRASRASIYNSIIIGFPTGLQLDGPNVVMDATSGELQIRNSIVTGTFSSNQEFNVEGWFNTPAFGNRILADPIDIGLEYYWVSQEDAPAAPASGVRSVAVYPNPAVGAAQVVFELEHAQHVRLAVYDLLGREVAVLRDGMAPAGTVYAGLDVSSFASGVYVVRLQGEAAAIARRLTVVR